MPTTYLVNEVFLTIQGEATFAGTPAVFIRLQGCGVGCAFCDTKHTWSAPDEKLVSRLAVVSKGAEPQPTFAKFTTAALAGHAWGISRGARHVVLTGGEPLEQDVGELAAALVAAGFGRVQVETSGTVALGGLAAHEDTWVTLSPKIGMPGGREVLREVVERADEIKHPTATPKHLAQLQELLGRRWHRPGVPVWLQPLSMHPGHTAKCVEWCLEHGYRLSLQTHRYLGAR